MFFVPHGSSLSSLLPSTCKNDAMADRTHSAKLFTFPIPDSRKDPVDGLSGVRLLSAESPAADLVRYIELSDCEKAPILRKFKNVFNENLNYRKG